MAFQAAPLTAEVRVLFDLNDGEKRASFSLYAKRASGAWTEADLNLLADSVRDQVIAAYVPVMSEDHAFVGVIAKDISQEFGLSVELMEAAPVAGTVASPALPNSNAVVVTWIGASGSAPRRGRIYLPSPTESQVTNSRLTGAAQTAIDGAAAQLRASVEDPPGLASVSQALVSRYQGSEVIGTTSTGKQIKEATKRPVAVVNGVIGRRVSNRIDSQRRRNPREAA